jgi:hypothetical protein
LITQSQSTIDNNCTLPLLHLYLPLGE